MGDGAIVQLVAPSSSLQLNDHTITMDGRPRVIRALSGIAELR